MGSHEIGKFFAVFNLLGSTVLCVFWGWFCYTEAIGPQDPASWERLILGYGLQLGIAVGLMYLWLYCARDALSLRKTARS